MLNRIFRRMWWEQKVDKKLAVALTQAVTQGIGYFRIGADDANDL